jgi:hypothetical protein
MHIGQCYPTEYGTVYVGEAWSIRADHSALYAWSHRPDGLWPCCSFNALETLSTTFDSRGNLVDMDTVPPEQSVCSYELNAWSSAVLRLAGLSDHPAIRS